MIDNTLSSTIKKRIRGKLPMKRDLVDWSDEKWLQFIRIIEFFTKEGKFNINKETVVLAVERAKDEPFWDEFITRIDMLNKHTPFDTIKKRFYTFARVPLTWIKNNPHAVTEEMFNIMEVNPRMAWASSNFKLVETDIGVQVIEREVDEHTDPNRTNRDPRASTPKTPVEQYERAKLSMLTLLNALAKSIPNNAIKDMTVRERLQAFDKLLNTATKIIGQKSPNSVIFQQINVNKAKRSELEDSFLKYTKTQ